MESKALQNVRCGVRDSAAWQLVVGELLRGQRRGLSRRACRILGRLVRMEAQSIHDATAAREG